MTFLIFIQDVLGNISDMDDKRLLIEQTQLEKLKLLQDTERLAALEQAVNEGNETRLALEKIICKLQEEVQEVRSRSASNESFVAGEYLWIYALSLGGLHGI